MLRPAFVIALLALLLIPMVSPWLFFHYKQQQIRKSIKRQIKAGVPEEELVLLRIPTAMESGVHPDFQRIHAREFRYRGMMYDIIRQEKGQDTTLYWCILDVKESGLFAMLDQWSASAFRRDIQQQHHCQLWQLFWQGLYCRAEIRAPAASRPHSAQVPSERPASAYQNRQPVPDAPPPERCFPAQHHEV